MSSTLESPRTRGPLSKVQSARVLAITYLGRKSPSAPSKTQCWYGFGAPPAAPKVSEITADAPKTERLGRRQALFEQFLNFRAKQPCISARFRRQGVTLRFNSGRFARAQWQSAFYETGELPLQGEFLRKIEDLACVWRLFSKFSAGVFGGLGGFAARAFAGFFKTLFFTFFLLSACARGRWARFEPPSRFRRVGPGARAPAPS